MARARKRMDHEKLVQAVASGSKKFVRYDEAAEIYSVGMNTIKKWALIKTIFTVKRRLNPVLEIEGILLTMVDNRTNYAKDIVLEVNDVLVRQIPVCRNDVRQ